MHPPLFKPHPRCEEVVQALVACHEKHPVAKFFGECNEFKVALDRCFVEEKEERRRANMRAARAERERYEELRKQS